VQNSYWLKGKALRHYQFIFVACMLTCASAFAHGGGLELIFALVIGAFLLTLALAIWGFKSKSRWGGVAIVPFVVFTAYTFYTDWKTTQYKKEASRLAGQAAQTERSRRIGSSSDFQWQYNGVLTPSDASLMLNPTRSLNLSMRCESDVLIKIGGTGLQSRDVKVALVAQNLVPPNREPDSVETVDGGGLVQIEHRMNARCVALDSAVIDLVVEGIKYEVPLIRITGREAK
jgi:hypothetical protein